MATIPYEEHRGGRFRLARLDVVVAIACLGTLATVALPRQREVMAETRRTETHALVASLRSAASFGHALWIARGAPDSLAIERNGATVRIAMVNGYPSAASLPLLLEEPELAGFARTGATFRYRGAGEGCSITYVPPQRPGTAPGIDADTSGC
jgi:hypothetical protein